MPQRTKAERNQYMKDWYARNPGYTSRYKETSKLRARERRADGGLKHDKKLRDVQRLLNPVLYLLRKTRSQAKTKGFEFDLTEDWMKKNLAADVCQATGLPFSHETGTAAFNNPWAATVDRRDPTRGYTQDNCWVVCWVYNCAKQAWTEETVMKMAQALTDKI